MIDFTIYNKNVIHNIVYECALRRQEGYNMYNKWVIKTKYLFNGVEYEIVLDDSLGLRHPDEKVWEDRAGKDYEFDVEAEVGKQLRKMAVSE